MNIVHNQGQLVYHYTSMSTFKAIMEGVDDGNIIFHASGMHCLNDSSEFLYGFKEFRRILPAIENKIGNINDSLKLSCTIDSEDLFLNGKWSENYAKFLLEGNKTPFVVSTSAHNDNIPMWVMYGDDGRGVALGLDISNLFKREKTEKRIHNLVSLDELHALKIVQNLSLDHPAIIISICDYKRYLEEVSQMSNEEDIMRLKIITLYKMSVYASALVKHPAFKFEREWRILDMANKTSDIQYKTNAKGQIVPYIEIRIPKDKLCKLIIGPRCNSPHQKAIINGLLKECKIDNCKVVLSKAPYK